MKKTGTIITIAFIILLAAAVSGNPEVRLLPENFAVYVRGNSVINHPMPGFTRRILPTVNRFRGRPGCYIACYSHNRDGSVYGVGGNIYVMGQLRVRGRYIRRVCHPEGHVNRDISAADSFRRMCNQAFSTCRNGCWAGGDTGGWFGIQQDGSLR